MTLTLRRLGRNVLPLVTAVTFLLLAPYLQPKLHAAAPALSREPLSGFSIRWVPNALESNKVTAEVSGLNAAAIRELGKENRTSEQWQRLLSVFAEQGDLFADVGLPAMLGSYRVENGTLRFDPQFPFVQDVHYRAVFHPESLPGGHNQLGKPVTSVFQLPRGRTTSTTIVSHVYPSADILPENLLKFYLHFSAPMRGGHIYEHIHLRTEAGQDIELPFLELDEELWNPTMTRLTLFIDPGRIKREVKPLEEIGPALETGKRYTLIIDRKWEDAAGLPLKETFRKSFKAGPPDREPPDPRQWKVESPQRGSTNPLVISFPEPMDHALAQRMIRVVTAPGELVAGQTLLTDHERRWSFTPSRPWNTGPHTVLVQTTIEDMAGNNIGKAFEVDLFDGIQRRLTNSTVRLPFEIK